MKDKNKQDTMERQRKLELKIRNLYANGAATEEVQKAYDEFHIFLLEHGIRGASPIDSIYKSDLSPIDNLFLDKIGEGKSVLEIGLGDGHFLFACAKKGNAVSGIDISTVAVNRSMALFEREEMSASIVLGDAKSLLFPSETFDFVISKDLVEHLPEVYLPIHLSEAQRVLKPGGCYMLWTPSKLLGHTSLGTHLKEYSLSEIIAELKKAEFEPVILSLPIFVATKSIKSITNSTVIDFLLAYEKILEDLLHVSRIQIQNSAMYLIIPPICVAAYKSVEAHIE
jgi:ubiquinone/menaquinone biosynthesis C-methylase UbiE